MLMPEHAKVITSDEEIDAAIEQARIFEKYDRRVASVSYSGNIDAFLLRLEHGVTYTVPRRLLQGLTDANPDVLRGVEILGQGTGLYWPALDVAHSVSGLLAGVFGSSNWMNQLYLNSIRSRIPA
jgi:hypothetical protein